MAGARRRTTTSGMLIAAVLLAGCAPAPAEPEEPPVIAVIPAPASLRADPDAPPFPLEAATRIVARGAGARAVAELVAPILRAQTGLELPLAASERGDEPSHEAAAGDLLLETTGGAGDVAGADDTLGTAPATPSDESYALVADAHGLRITAAAAAGLFAGAQTLRQLLPPAPGVSPAVPAVSIEDAPRFAYRGAMLDVARHFRPVDEVLRYLDEIALLKLNVLHLHLTDDQGWRIEIPGRPELTGVGASTSVGGDGGGFYTTADYRRIVEYAAARFITIVPEVDLPGHTNAALSATPELNCDGVAPKPYEGIEVGFSSLCASPERAEATDRFLGDVTRELARITPGPYLHLGGDESLSTSHEDYLDLVRRMTVAGAATGKTLVGWHEMGASRELPPGTIGQYWSFTTPQDDAASDTMSFVEQGGRVILSPADVAYLDMRYPENPQGPLGGSLGLLWADGPTSLRDAYGWEPTRIVPGIGEDAILGIEAPIWTETLRTMDEVEFLAFPRIAALAELAWSPAPPAGEVRDFDGFTRRIVRFGALLDSLGIVFHRADGVQWDAVSP